MTGRMNLADEEQRGGGCKAAFRMPAGVVISPDIVFARIARDCVGVHHP
jgi:hypothetical protein